MLNVVVVELLLGILIGPQVLGIAHMGPSLNLLSTFGLAFLFFLAGNEVEIERVRGRPSELGALGWVISLAIALAFGSVLHASGLVLTTIYVAVALTATSMGTLVPILGDSDDLDTRFGAYVLAAASAGEIGPIIAISILFANGGHHRTAAGLLLVFAIIAMALAVMAKTYRQAISREQQERQFSLGRDSSYCISLATGRRGRIKTHCKRGHALNDENIKIVRNGAGLARACLTCCRESNKRFAANKRSAARQRDRTPAPNANLTSHLQLPVAQATSIPLPCGGPPFHQGGFSNG